MGWNDFVPSVGNYRSCESYSTDYTDSMDVGVCQMQALNMEMSSLTESVLKQLETPKMVASVDHSLNFIDHVTLERLYNSGVNVKAIVSPRTEKMIYANHMPKCELPGQQMSYNAYGGQYDWQQYDVPGHGFEAHVEHVDEVNQGYPNGAPIGEGYPPYGEEPFVGEAHALEGQGSGYEGHVETGDQSYQDHANQVYQYPDHANGMLDYLSHSTLVTPQQGSYHREQTTLDCSSRTSLGSFDSLDHGEGFLDTVLGPNYSLSNFTLHEAEEELPNGLEHADGDKLKRIMDMLNRNKKSTGQVDGVRSFPRAIDYYMNLSSGEKDGVSEMCQLDNQYKWDKGLGSDAYDKVAMKWGFGNDEGERQGKAKVQTIAQLLMDSIRSGELRGKVVSIAKDQMGCRMLQRNLDDCGREFIDGIFHEIDGKWVELMNDPFGNYLCQKLLTLLTSHQLLYMITVAKGNLVDVALNTHGTRAIQKLIEVVTNLYNTRDVGNEDECRTIIEVLQKLTSILNDGVLQLVNDLNGNHTIQKCLSSLPQEFCQFIYDAMYKNCVKFATHRHGCCVMQRCIDAASRERRRKLVGKIIENIKVLVEDAYGNYVVQYVILLKDDEVNDRIVSILSRDIIPLAKQKFSSNVVERCLMFAPEKARVRLINQFLESPFEKLILDPYGNYVIQRILNVATPEQLEVVFERIKPHLNELKVAAIAKKFASKLGKHKGETRT